MKSVFQMIATIACAVVLTACGAAANTEKPVVLDPNTQVKEFTFPDVVVGTGTAAAAGDTLDVVYTGWLYDASKPENKGAKFDATLPGAGFPFVLGIGQVILGWDRGLVGMKVGGTRILSIPYDLGYGKVGKPPVIPGYAGLLFEVKLIGVTKK
ncbi:peptidylprolyl isomerase [Janthinobacterium sp. BJB1]|uniref:FKBP-type peptidyl-prolyl cis-trans isomerase n=1 Tax=Janthinobacterium sp. GW458P TaxID=1981504 RepID=UPI000A320BDB|nr:FKBP-type peptidyl-prolyl cis-trans isomerase [Janthinobacterium sp. GW458P]MBE3026595.1 FKBP-type peptidyl-prolyl cis-trans isomerase [Janthinobacterium sp. GW458P]PHV16939.1 peptidylprolyl isomerase [Janthinobacterium sp. BJB303]PJC97778.1 peptidylprolyl isomerase [Janthinobacterium sp. BJB1]